MILKYEKYKNFGTQSAIKNLKVGYFVQIHRNSTAMCNANLNVKGYIMVSRELTKDGVIDVG